MDQDIAVSPYVTQFVTVYLAGIIFSSAVFWVFDLNHSISASIVVLVAAAMFAVSRFIKDNQRVPSKNEKSKMLWLSFLFSWVVSLLFSFTSVLILAGMQGILDLYQVATQLNMIIIVVPFVILSLLYLMVLNYSYGGLAKKQFEMLQKFEKSSL